MFISLINKDNIMTISEQEILRYNRLYRAGTPEISDKEYDLLLDVYKLNVSDEQYKNFRIKLMEEPGKVKHPYIMGSLEKTKADEGDDSLVKWLTKNNIKELFVSAKIDGLSVRLFYVNGKLVEAATRGDGEYGEDCYNKAIYFCPVELPVKFTGNIRGEIVLTKENYIKLCEISNKEYKSSRGAAVGLINSKEILEDAASQYKLLNVITYEIIGENTTKPEQFFKLIDMGFKVPFNSVVEVDINTIKEDLLDLFNETLSIVNFNVDGLVITSSNNKIFENKKIPENTVAYKANLNIGITKIIDIEWNISKGNLYKPVGILDPVQVGDSMISRVALYNYKWVIDRNIRYGAKVTILLSGEIIPKPMEIDNSEVLNNKFINYPKVCEFCGTTLLEEGVELKCPNKDCSEPVLLQIAQFIRRLKIVDASTQTLRNLGITSFDNFISWRPDESYKSQIKLYKEINNKIFSIKKEKIFAALDCDGMGEKTVNKLIEYFSFDTILSGKIDYSKGLPKGIGETTVKTFILTLGDNIAIYNKLILDSRYNEPKENVVTPRSSGHLSDKSYCFTGKLNTMTRPQAEEMVISGGGKVAGVSKNLTYLVTNDKDSGSAKNKKAQDLGITLINEDEFLEQVNNQSVNSL